MNKLSHPKNNGKREENEGKITRADIEAHLVRWGRSIPYALPMVDCRDEAPAKEEKPKEETASVEAKPEKKEDTRYPGFSPLNTTGLMNKLIHDPRDVNSPY
jgi:hypothetical protein